MNTYNEIWLGVKWFFGDFCIQVITAPLGILKDALDIYGISWKLFCLGISLAGALIALIVRYIKDRM